MKTLLIAEMKRAIELLESKEKPFDYNWEDTVHRAAELKQILLLVRKHSIELEKQAKSRWD
jgi:hypothetical protein